MLGRLDGIGNRRGKPLDDSVVPFDDAADTPFSNVFTRTAVRGKCLRADHARISGVKPFDELARERAFSNEPSALCSTAMPRAARA
jgi:hypothetical protein